MKTPIFLLLLISFQIKLLAINYYVSPSGNDANNGTSIATAWQTFQKALNSATAGSTVYILAGTYNEKTTLGVSGTAGSPIVFRNYNTDIVIIDGTGITSQDEILAISDKSYITFQGLIFQNSIGNNSIGIFAQGICDGLTFKGNTIRQIFFSSNPSAPVNSNTNANPFLFWGTDATTPISNLMIDSNFIYNCRTGFSEALALNGNISGFEIKNNVVYDITNIGIDIIGHYGECPNPANDQARNGTIKWNTVYNCVSAYATSGGIYVDGGRDLVIENNICYQNGWGIEVGCEIVGKTTSNVTVRNNLLYDNTESGLAFGGYDYPANSGKITNCVFTNNTIFSNDNTNTGNGEVVLNYSENCDFKNNIVSVSANNFALTHSVATPINLTSDYNLYYCTGGISNIEFLYNNIGYMGFASWQSATGKDANSIFGNPNFASISLPNPDLHIASSSPAIDAGDPSFVAGAGEVDMDTQARIYNSRVDIGADEFGSAPSAMNTFFETSELLIYPNPTSGEFTVCGLQSMVKSLNIYDVFGKLVFQTTVNRKQGTVNLSEARSGEYILLISTEEETCRQKLLIVK